jgi:hypothetical protein
MNHSAAGTGAAHSTRAYTEFLIDGWRCVTSRNALRRTNT